MKIICVGRNYIEHAKELHNPVPMDPLIFMKPSTSLLINGKPFYYPEFSNNIQYEVEVILKIGKNGRHIQPSFAEDYIESIGLGIDFTARDVQNECKRNGHPWEIAKAFDHSAVVGEFIQVSAVSDLNNIPFSLKKNGTVVQIGNTADMIFDFKTLINYISSRFTLHIGDYVFTGTPKGVGPVAIGDQLEGFIGEKSIFTCAVR